MRLRTTSTHRTYRYVRVALVGVVVFLGVGVGVQAVLGGGLGSVSAAYYTPARNVFVGALCAVALALLALSGRSVEQALLDLAAVLAPVIALVPTPIGPGGVPGVDPGCATTAACIPPGVLPEVANGMLTLSVIGALGVATALVLAVIQRTLTVGLGATILAAGLLVQAGTVWWAVWPDSFFAGAHYAATFGFFGIVAAVAAIAASRPTAGSERRRRILRVVYAVTATGIGVALLVLAIQILSRGEDALVPRGPFVLIGEAVALLFFAIFWVAQTVELWNDVDAALF